ncbi:MAG TPA: hypothetical protein VIP98_05645 [Microlunatus sp.]
MTDPRVNPGMIEAEVRSAYQNLPVPDVSSQAIISAVRAKVERRRTTRTVLRLVMGLCLVVALVVAGVQIVRSTIPEVPVTTSPGKSGAVTSDQAASCAFDYKRKTLAKRDWAADATVRDIDVGKDDARVTLTVRRWYRGGTTATVTARMSSPMAESGPPDYGIGTRLLISGDRDGQTYFGWGCGFTRYYDPTTAIKWQKWLK